MTEIELKAHVADPEATERAIRGFAAFTRETVKSDVYWKRADHLARTTTLDRHAVTAAIAAILSFAFALAAAISVIAGASKETAIAICLAGFAFASLFSLVRRGRKHPEAVQGPEAGHSPQAGHSLKIRIREESGKTVVTYKRKEMSGDIEVNDEREFEISDRSDFEALVSDLGFAPFIRKEKNTKTFSYSANDGTKIGIELSLVAGLGWFVELEILAEDPDASETDRAREALRSTLSRCGVPESAIERRYYTDMLSLA